MSLSVSPHNFRYATVGCNKIALYIVVLLVQKNIEGGKTNNETPVLYAMLHAPKGVCKGVVAPPPPLRYQELIDRRSRERASLWIHWYAFCWESKFTGRRIPWTYNYVTPHSHNLPPCQDVWIKHSYEHTSHSPILNFSWHLQRTEKPWTSFWQLLSVKNCNNTIIHNYPRTQA